MHVYICEYVFSIIWNYNLFLIYNLYYIKYAILDAIALLFLLEHLMYVIFLNHQYIKCSRWASLACSFDFPLPTKGGGKDWVTSWCCCAPSPLRAQRRKACSKVESIVFYFLGTLPWVSVAVAAAWMSSRFSCTNLDLPVPLSPKFCFIFSSLENFWCDSKEVSEFLLITERSRIQSHVQL